MCGALQLEDAGGTCQLPRQVYRASLLLATENRPSIPYPSAAGAASESASGSLSHCCPGLQILRFLPKKQSVHRGESQRMPIWREEKGFLGSRLQSLPVSQHVMRMKTPPAGPQAVLRPCLGTSLQTPLCMKWSGIILFFPNSVKAEFG